MREIVLDTETTGIDPAEGHRIVEIGAVELVNTLPTGRTFHRYLNPERPMPPEAFQIHGLGDAFLSRQPRFWQIAAEFVDFLGDAPLVIHNAAFDVAMINAEFARLRLPPLAPGRAIDTLEMARRRFPGSPASLDALCKRFGVDTAARDRHGALLDCKLLAEVYLELRGGRQHGLALAPAPVATGGAGATAGAAGLTRPGPLAPRLTQAERTAHAAFVAELGPGALWLRLAGDADRPDNDRPDNDRHDADGA